MKVCYHTLHHEDRLFVKLNFYAISSFRVTVVDPPSWCNGLCRQWGLFFSKICTWFSMKHLTQRCGARGMTPYLWPLLRECGSNWRTWPWNLGWYEATKFRILVRFDIESDESELLSAAKVPTVAKRIWTWRLVAKVASSNPPTRGQHAHLAAHCWPRTPFWKTMHIVNSLMNEVKDKR